MNVEWSATSPQTHRVGATMCTGLPELEARFIELRSHGEGYIEVWLPTDESPQLTVGFRKDCAVVHQHRGVGDETTTSLLFGDDSTPPGGEVEVPLMDESALFTGHFVMSVDRAWDAVRDFVRTRSPAGLGEWYEL